MSEQNDEMISKLREAEIERLSKLPAYPSDRAPGDGGVLLSDQIRHYCDDDHQLISPFREERLRPAGYDLSVGYNYSILGEKRALNDGLSLTIGPYQVAIIETLETLNLPNFLIGRWNIRVALAYKGLLWVGGAQVDPGFRGRLCCPIYNLSTEPVTLHFRQELAMIDFVTTTEFKTGSCNVFRWSDRKMVVFQEYPSLKSGIEAKVDDFGVRIDRNNEELEKKQVEVTVEANKALRDIQTRIDTFIPLVFTVVSVLFAGLGVIATKSSEPSLIVTSLSLVSIATVALYFALRPYYLMSKLIAGIDTKAMSTEQVLQQASTSLRVGLTEVVLASLFILVSLGADGWSLYTVHHLGVQTSSVQAQVSHQAIADKAALEQEIRELRQQYELKVAAIQKDVDAIRERKNKP